MNWKAGLLRLWLAFSVFWILLVFVHGYRPQPMSKLEQIRSQLQMDQCEDERKENPSAHPDLFECFPEIAPAVAPWLLGTTTWFEVEWYARTILIPPMALFALGIVGLWIAKGFGQNP